MRGGRLFRYCATSAETSEVAQAEKEFAAMVNQKYALGVNSCSSAIMLALMAVECGVFQTVARRRKKPRAQCPRCGQYKIDN